MTYQVIIEKGPRNYGAYIPALPGCVATAKTIHELKARMRTALAWHIAGLIEDGEPVPQPDGHTELIEAKFVPA